MRLDDLGHPDPSGSPVTGEAVLNDVISKGTEVSLELFKSEKEPGGERSPSGGTVEIFEGVQPIAAVGYETTTTHTTSAPSGGRYIRRFPGC